MVTEEESQKRADYISEKWEKFKAFLLECGWDTTRWGGEAFVIFESGVIAGMDYKE